MTGSPGKKVPVILGLIRAQRRVCGRLMARFPLAAAATSLLFSRLDLDPGFRGIMTGVVQVTGEMKAESRCRLPDLQELPGILLWAGLSAARVGGGIQILLLDNRLFFLSPSEVCVLIRGSRGVFALANAAAAPVSVITTRCDRSVCAQRAVVAQRRLHTKI